MKRLLFAFFISLFLCNPVLAAESNIIDRWATDAEVTAQTRTDKGLVPAHIPYIMATPGAIGETTPSTIRGKFVSIEKTTGAVTLTVAECSGTLITNYGWNGTVDQTFTFPAAEAGLFVKFLNLVTATKDIYWDTPGSTTQFVLDGTACGDGERVWTDNATKYESILFHTLPVNATAYDWNADTEVGTWLDKGS